VQPETEALSRLSTVINVHERIQFGMQSSLEQRAVILQ
jgi:hypothetical protein